MCKWNINRVPHRKPHVKEHNHKLVNLDSLDSYDSWKVTIYPLDKKEEPLCNWIIHDNHI